MRVKMLVAMILAGAVSAAAGNGDWKSFTAKREVRDLEWDPVRSTVWVATGGGMFSFTTSDSSFTEFTTSEGLKSIDLTAVAVDAEGMVWTGSNSGMIHRYNPSNGTWQYITDISIRLDPSKTINRLRASGDTVFVLSDIGVSLFSLSRFEFGDTYGSFGSSPAQITGKATDIATYGGKIWVATRNGLASTPVSNSNPAAPESWIIQTGLPSNNIRSIGRFDTSLYVATSAGLSKISPSGTTLVSGTQGIDVLGLSVSGSAPLIASSAGLWMIADTGAVALGGGLPYQVSCSTTEGRFFLGTTNQGIVDVTVTASDPPQAVTRNTFPPGPASNKFVGLAVDTRGVVWTGTGIASGEGILSFDGKRWKSYTSAVDPRFGSGNFYKVTIGPNDSKWASSWGDGIALLDDGGSLRKVLNSSNGLSPSIDPDFTVVGGIATDDNGIVWVTNRTPRGDTTLVTVAPDTTLGYIRGISTRLPPVIVLADVVIDQNGTKWFTNFSRFEGVLPSALYFYNERFALPRTTDGWGRMTISDGLTSNKVYALAVGRDGEVWIGSDEGISILFTPGQPYAIAQYHPLRDQVVQAIVVDPLNNKWVATRQGVFVMSSDGTTILAHYTEENTDGKLVDNDVASIAIDPKSGIMYFGTERGLSSLQTQAVEPVRSFGDLSVAPNPYLLSSDATLTIDGLIENSLVKILSIDGNLVAEFRSPGGRVASWDGRDTRGDLVGTGVYIVVAYSEDGTKVASGKVAVVRK